VRRNVSIFPEKYQHLPAARFARRNLTVLIPDGSAANEPLSSRGPVVKTCLSLRPANDAAGAVRSGAAAGLVAPIGVGVVVPQAPSAPLVTQTRRRLERIAPSLDALRSWSPLSGQARVTVPSGPVCLPPTLAPGTGSLPSVTFTVTVSPGLARAGPDRSRTRSPKLE
jgi:hypothetical protein